MDLIYADEKMIDVGILMDYKLDMAYGNDENDFECTVVLENNPCKQDYILYIENTDYGGIVDSISPDSDSVLRYTGRTWHGVLNSKVIEPDAGYDYLLLAGDANHVLEVLIHRMGLDELFYADTADSGIYIMNYEMRYELGYDGICKMLSVHNAKLLMKWQDGKVLLWCELIHDYSIDEEFDTSQISFSLKKNYNVCNHIVCLGQGELKDRHVIHMFTNEYGGIQPYYTSVDEPTRDSEYILDKRNQVLFGKDEITEVYDYSSAETVENYLQLVSRPADWDKNYVNYYVLEDNEYKQLERNYQDVYELQRIAPADWAVNYNKYYVVEDDTYAAASSMETYTALNTVPADWSKNYANYYELKNEKFKEVEGVEVKTYKKINKEPKNWKKRYEDYYVSDGISYSSASGDSKDIYNVQTSEPSEWKTAYRDAYCLKGGKYKQCSELIEVPEFKEGIYYKKIKKEYELIKEKPDDWKTSYANSYVKTSSKYVLYIDTLPVPRWKKNTYYNKGSKTIAPDFNKRTYYVASSKMSAPDFTSSVYYTKSTSAPDWDEETYYTKYEGVDVGIDFFDERSYYEKELDHYRSLADGAIEKFKEYYSSDEIDISLDGDSKYDIGDIVGASEPVTGIFVSQPIVKKIVTIERDNESIKYEVMKNGS